MRVEQQSSKDTPQPPKSTSTAVLLFGTIADTTWRMFVPVIGLLLIGDWLDRALGMRPLITIIGAFVGAIISVILVRKQLRQ